MPPAPLLSDPSARVRVRFWTWLRRRPDTARYALPLAGLLLALPLLLLRTSGDGLLFVLLFSVLLLGAAGRALAREWAAVCAHCARGALAPALVVSDRPPLVAVPGGLDLGNDRLTLAVKILPLPSGLNLATGDRLTAISVPRGADFFPLALPAVTSDPRALEDALRRVATGGDGVEVWADLERRLARLPHPYRPGLYRVNIE